MAYEIMIFVYNYYYKPFVISESIRAIGMEKIIYDGDASIKPLHFFLGMINLFIFTPRSI